MSFSGIQPDYVLPYLAGIVDGEGFIGINKKGNGNYVPRVYVAMTNIEPINLLKARFGGVVYTSRTASGRVLYRWQLVRFNEIKEFCLTITQYLIVKKTQASIVLDYVDTPPIPLHRPRTTDQELSRRSNLYAKIKPLNAVGSAALAA
jgi:hypothetical protein